MHYKYIEIFKFGGVGGGHQDLTKLYRGGALIFGNIRGGWGIQT